MSLTLLDCRLPGRCYICDNSDFLCGNYSCNREQNRHSSKN